ncbi:hypothetical protein [Ruegeria marina]|uniref:Uncharacterized protein n=1 Tax=Ruegeria marina TaxID=639004 RepID=A0A1G6S499_9RHOB|nr:hypothetical protein [Ruegeria marina]SDD11504.1 hypothetical protein SAMN04488239_105166 [Ruegeria marina]
MKHKAPDTPHERLERRLRHQYGLPEHLARTIADLRHNKVVN